MPDWKLVVREYIARLNLEGTAESDLTEEFADHLEDRYRELSSGGASEAEACRETLAELENTYPLRPSPRKMSPLDATPVLGAAAPSVSLLHDFGRDMRYALRTMRRSPLFVVFVVLTLALGIGANSTVFTVINTLLLNPLPVPHLSQFSAVGAARAGASAQTAPLPLSYPDLKEYQERNSTFESLAGYTKPSGLTFQEKAASESVFCELVTSNYFSTLGLSPARGRFFLRDEDRVAGAHAVAVMNYGTWQGRFGGVQDILGKTVRLNGLMFTVVGVAPPHFIGINGIFGPDFWIPLSLGEQLFPNQMQGMLHDRGKPFFQVIGKRKPGISNAQVQANLAGIAGNLAREYPATDEGRTALVRPVRDILFASSNGSSMPVLFASAGLLLVVGIVLLIACSNVANLLLARAASRQQEIAVRLAMGASRSRLIRQLLTESLLLALLSGIVGLLLAFAGLRLLFSSLPSAANFITPKMDWLVLLFSLVVSCATGLLFGMIPAWKASRASVAESLKEESRTAGKSRKKVSTASALLVAQVAFSFLLLVTAALFLRSIAHAYALDPGFQTEHLAIFLASPGQAGFKEERTRAFYKDARDRVLQLPGVTSAAWASNLPLWSQPRPGLEIEGRDKRSRSDKLSTIVSTIGPSYFDTAGVRLESGRPFRTADGKRSLPVAIVNQKLAHDFWPDESALGKRILVPGEKQFRQIVGIARTANYTTWAETPQLCVYLPLEQNYADGMTLYVRSKGDPRTLLQAVQKEMHSVAPQVLLTVRTGRQIVDGGLFGTRMVVILLSVFGLLALGLASIGLYGILAYSVAQRKREIGLRMALGAASGSVLRLVLGQGMRLVLIGVGIGCAAALLIGRALSKVLYGVGGSDPLSIAGAAVILLLVALTASYFPARWASRVDPLIALREG